MSCAENSRVVNIVECFVMSGLIAGISGRERSDDKSHTLLPFYIHCTLKEVRDKAFFLVE